MNVMKGDGEENADEPTQLTPFPELLPQAELEKQEGLIKKYREELANRDEELEFVREELREKTEELQDINTDLEVKEASFNNSFKENEEQHREEVEILVTKVEEAKVEISGMQFNRHLGFRLRTSLRATSGTTLVLGV